MYNSGKYFSINSKSFNLSVSRIIVRDGNIIAIDKISKKEVINRKKIKKNYFFYNSYQLNVKIFYNSLTLNFS